MKELNLVDPVDGIYYGAIEVKGHDIVKIKKLDKEKRGLPYLLPGFVDPHIHGAAGVDFIDATYERLQKMEEFLREVIAIAKSHDQIKMWVIPCDAEVQGVYPVQNGNIQQIMSIEMKGDGGTNFKPVFEHIDEHIRNCRILVYLTDGYGDFPEHQPRYHTIWVVNKEGRESKEFPFGTVLRL